MAEKLLSLQDQFLNSVRKAKSPVTVFLVKGVKLQGIVTWFDNFCVLLRRDGTDVLDPKALYWRKPEARQGEFPLSKTIVEHVLRERLGLLVTDAAQDERFASGQSIIALGIREVICVPMKGRHESIGVLYLDTQSPRVAAEAGTRFSDDHLALAIAIAHQAALAVEETHYHQAMLQAERLAAIGQTIVLPA